MQSAAAPSAIVSTPVRMLLIFFLALYLHWAAYWLIAGGEMAEGPIGYLFGLELIVFFGHVPFATLTLFLVFMAVNVFPAIFLFCAIAPERMTPSSTVWTGLIAAAPLLFSTVAAYGLEAWIERSNAASPTQELDLDSATSDVGRSGFVDLKGWGEPRYASGYEFSVASKYGKSTKHSHLFVPVVQAGWTLASPVKYFVHYVDSATASTDSHVPLVTPGKLGRHLPMYVRWQMQRKGLRIDPSYVVIEAVESDRHGHRADPQRRLILLFSSLLVTVPCVLLVPLAYAQTGRSFRAKAATL